PPVPDHRAQEADRPGPDPLRSRLRPSRPVLARVPGPDLPDDPTGSGRRLAGQARHDRQLLQPLQRAPEPEAARGATPLADAVSPAAVQCDGGSAERAREPGRRLLRLPSERPHERRRPRGGRRPPASRGAACFACHQNGHTNGADHEVGDIRPQEFRHRIETTSLRGVNIQRLFGSQRALKTVEDFTEFEQRAAYFDGDPVIATKKGVNILERGSQVHFMAEVQEILAFPPAPKRAMDGKLDPALATESELRGQELFFGKANCASCHPAPYYTDNSMHNLKLERFFKPRLINGAMAGADGPIKTFPLRGIKDSPPYMHDGRLLTLDDTVEFFNLVLGTQLTPAEKKDLVAFPRALSP